MSTASLTSGTSTEKATKTKTYIYIPVDEVEQILTNCGVPDAKEKAQEIGILCCIVTPVS